MINSQLSKRPGALGSVIISAMFIVLGIITLYDTTGYSDSDSKVFPQAAAVILILCASISLIVGLIKAPKEEGFGVGIWWRRVLLVAAMLATCAMMPFFGFLPASFIAIVGCLLAAMHDTWTLKKGIVYAGSGLAMAILFYSLFRFVLHVPLP